MTSVIVVFEPIFAGQSRQDHSEITETTDLQNQIKGCLAISQVWLLV